MSIKESLQGPCSAQPTKRDAGGMASLNTCSSYVFGRRLSTAVSVMDGYAPFFIVAADAALVPGICPMSSCFSVCPFHSFLHRRFRQGCQGGCLSPAPASSGRSASFSRQRPGLSSRQGRSSAGDNTLWSEAAAQPPAAGRQHPCRPWSV